jgi:hypothetical protein
VRSDVIQPFLNTYHRSGNRGTDLLEMDILDTVWALAEKHGTNRVRVRIKTLARMLGGTQSKQTVYDRVRAMSRDGVAFTYHGSPEGCGNPRWLGGWFQLPLSAAAVRFRIAALGPRTPRRRSRGPNLRRMDPLVVLGLVNLEDGTLYRTPDPTCRGCSAVLAPSGGRPRRWCSERCRSASRRRDVDASEPSRPESASGLFYMSIDQ